MAIDWTQVLVVVLPYVVGHAFGALQMWLRLRHDAELGRSMRPGPGPKYPTTDNPNATDNGPPTRPRRSLPPRNPDS